MTLLALQNKFQKDLVNTYPNEEINSIFKLLVKSYLNFDAAEIFLEAKRELNKKEAGYFADVLIRLLNMEPVQHIIGEATFFDLSFKVNHNVLIPRPETEELVQWIISDFKKKVSNKKLQILDIGTGSGCIAISLAKNIPNTEIWAIDISTEALEIANQNAILNNSSINFLNLDILSAEKLPHNFDIIISNPPYVKENEKCKMHDNVLDFEPDKALFVMDTNPLIFYNKITKLAMEYLNQSGLLYFEINQYLGQETVSLIKNIGFKNVSLKKDFLGNDRMIRAKKE